MTEVLSTEGALVLESGGAFPGLVHGPAGVDEAWGEVVFNTCMTGYQEVATDPSYAGQVVVMTYPLIGNYGCREDTAESSGVHCRALVVRELSPSIGHPKGETGLAEYLAEQGIICISGVDTRALTRHLREHGALRGIITTSEKDAPEAVATRAKSLPTITDEDHVAAVSTREVIEWKQEMDPIFKVAGDAATPSRIVVVDLGVKYNQLRALRSRGAEVIVVPHDTDYATVMSHWPVGVLLSNGPGDPANLDGPVALCRQLLENRVPVLGICLGHQVLGRAIGASTSRLGFGHHGGNHPVKDLFTGEVFMTSQNHEFQVDGNTIPQETGWYVSERNLHDQSVEGLRHPTLPAFSVQYHPEGAPGPQDRAAIFDEFLTMARTGAPMSRNAPAAVTVKKPKSVLVIGSGPVVIGQAAEFDYAGTQACRALREEGVRTVLVNSNPATIMTDEDSADAVYIEPLTVEVLERIIAAERPDGLLGTLGGQTGLNLTVALAQAGVLDKYNVEVIGTPLKAVLAAEDRAKFKHLLERIGEPTPDSTTVSSLAQAREFRQQIGLPLVVRPAFTLGGTGGGLCSTDEVFAERVASGLAASPIGQVLVERSLEGWREVEYEVVRDASGTGIVVCTMENVDPMGVHTGDSIVVAPTQTLTDREHQQLRSAALRIVGALEIAGGCNVQFALAPGSDDYYVIEVNPRVSRSSALASKATGYPIARVAAKIAVGLRLDEITNAVTGKTCAAFEPALDYCVAKIPRWPFDKFPDGDRRLGTQMKSTGEVMAIGRTFEEAINKAIRSLEQSRPPAEDLAEPVLIDTPNDRRLFAILNALHIGNSVDLVARRSSIGRWFIERLASIVEVEKRLQWAEIDDALLRVAKRAGLADARISELSGTAEEEIAQLCNESGIRPTYKCVDTCAAEFEAQTPYYYSTYETENEGIGSTSRDERRSVLVVGSGPIRIGQGIEFDYCSVRASRAIQEAGFDAVMVNSNPETVSTDFDCSTRLYFEPLDFESTCAVASEEQVIGVVTQFGGQTAVNLAAGLAASGLNMWGTSVEAIETTEERREFESLMRELGVAQPVGAATRSYDEALEIADRIGYPVLVRPSYVLGGRGMEIAHTRDALKRCVKAALKALPHEAHAKANVLIDKYLFGVEVDVDVISDGDTVVIPGLMEHIERAGVHSGDSMAAYPAPYLPPKLARQIVFDTTRIARALNIRGLCNLQFVLHEGKAHVLEVNPRASRTVPFLSKVSGVPMVDLAIKVMAGEKLSGLGWESGLVPPAPLFAIKAPVFSNSKLAAVDGALGPEMKSTGEVMGIDSSFEAAIEKAFLAASGSVPRGGGVLCSISDLDKAEALPILSRLGGLGFTVYATSGTAQALTAVGIQSVSVGKLDKQRPNVTDVIDEGRIALVINTVSHFDDTDAATAEDAAAAGRAVKDGYRIRQAAERRRIPCCTSLDTASALVDAIARQDRGEGFNVATVNAYRTPVRVEAR
jgi:carbamoyl-phosphate synthase large subunit